MRDIDSFRNVRDVNPAMASHLSTNGRLEHSENEIQMALERILDVPIHKTDWGGEQNDLYIANVVINDARTAAAFLLKGKGLRKRAGDQLVRLCSSPAHLFVVQFVGCVSEMVIADISDKVQAKRATGIDCH